MIAQELIIHGTLLLSLGQAYQFSTASSDVWISDPETLKAQVVGDKIILTAQKEGLAFVSGLKKDNQRVLVTSASNFQAYQRCPQALDNTDNSVSDLSPTALERLRRCDFPFLKLAEDKRPLLGQHFEDKEAHLLSKGLLFSQASWEQGRRRLSLSANSDKARYLRELAELAPFYELSMGSQSVARPGRTLIFEVVLFEFSTQRARNLGLRWPESVHIESMGGGVRLMAEQGAAQDSSAGSLFIGADFGESQGVGRVLARPSIRTLPGEKASFVSGGELPIRSSNIYNSQTVWKSYGLELELTPLADIETGAQEIGLHIKVELSEPDGSTAIDGIPGMLHRKLESRFDIRVGESTVLSTLLQSRSLRSLSGLAGINSLPVFGRALGNEKKSQHDSELWFAVRPQWESLP